MTKAVIKDPRLIYISWLRGKEDSGKTVWVEKFRETLTVDTLSQRQQFPEPRSTGDAIHGDLLNDEKLKEQVTDLVSVLTDPYLFANMRNPPETDPAELAHFIKAKKEHDTADRQRVWLAPLRKLRYKNYRITIQYEDKPHFEVCLADNLFWLHRLKGDNERFELPQETVAKWEDEISDAVNAILGESEELED